MNKPSQPRAVTGHEPHLDDPTTRYPRPPFEEQSQPWPGLACKMEPPPDHGETSYLGSGRLIGRRALITGGDSGMGRAAAIAFAREGADVAINYFPTKRKTRSSSCTDQGCGQERRGYPGRPAQRDLLCRSRILGRRTSWRSRYRGLQRGKTADPGIHPGRFFGGFRCHHENEYLRAVLDPEGRSSTSASRVGDHRNRLEQAYDPSPELYDYAQTKAATMNWVKSLAKQFAPKGIRVNGVAPGPIWTPLQVSGGATMEKLKTVRRPHSRSDAGPARGTRIDLRSARRQRCQLCDGPDLRRIGRRRTTLITDDPD